MVEEFLEEILVENFRTHKFAIIKDIGKTKVRNKSKD